MNSEAESTSNTKTQPSGLGMNGAALAHALNLLAKAGYVNTVADTSEGVTINIAGIRTIKSASGKLLFAVADTAEVSA